MSNNESKSTDHGAEALEVIAKSYNAFVVYMDRSTAHDDVRALIGKYLAEPGVTSIVAPALSDAINLVRAAFSIHPETTTEIVVETLELMLDMRSDGRPGAYHFEPIRDGDEETP